MDDDFVDVFPSAGGVGDSPVRTATQEHLGSGSPWPRPSISLSIPGLDTGGAAAAVSPAIPGSRGVATPSPAKEAELRSARGVSSGARDEDVVESPSPSPFPNRIGMALTIDPGGECVPTELEKKRAKLEKFRYECSEVSGSFMFVSGEDAAKQQGLVGSKGITHIINCAGPQCPNYLEYTGRFKFLRLNFYDHRTEDVAWFIYNAFDFIKTAQAQRGRILVHCVQGVSRSCTLAIAWLMLTTGIDYDEAYLRVRQGRPICAPNTGFICSLLEWQRRRQQPPSSPLLYRTAWHSPLFPNDLVLKICLHEDDRKHVLPTVAALDPRGCFLLVAPRGSPATVPSPAPAPSPASAPSSSRRSPELESNGSWRAATPPSSLHAAMPSTPSSAAARAAAAAAAAVVANAKASAAVAAAKEAQAVAAAAAADEALLVAKAAHASVAVPWTWRESEVGVRDRDGMRVIRRTPEGMNRRAAAQEGMAARRGGGSEGSGSGSSSRRTPEGAGRWTPEGPGGRRTPDGVGRPTPEKSVRRSSESLPAVMEGVQPGAAGEAKAAAAAAVVDVFVWKGSQSNPQMLELARQGAVWLREYEGWGAGASAPVVEEGQEPPEMLRHLEHQISDAREPPVYGDLSSPSPPPTALRSSVGGSGSSFMPCATPSTHGGGSRAPMLSPSETPTLSPAGPSPSPGGVNFSPYGCGVSPAGALFPYPTISPAGSTAVSPTTVHRLGGESSASRRCSMTSAAEMDEEEDDGGCLIMGLSALGEERPEPLLGVPPGRVGVGGVGEGERGGGDPLPRLFELADELGGQGASGLRWSQLTVFDDQDLVPQCCFLLVPPGEQNFLWVGKAFAGSHPSLGNLSLPQIQSLAREVAVRDARRQSGRVIPGPSDVETAVILVGDGNEPPEWWSSFERGYA